MPVKTNRKVALSADDKKQGKYVRVDTLGFEDSIPKQVYLEDVPFPCCWSSKSSQTMAAAQGCGI